MDAKNTHSVTEEKWTDGVLGCVKPEAVHRLRLKDRKAGRTGLLTVGKWSPCC